MTDAAGELRAWRKRLDLTQEAAAAALMTPHDTYRRWEMGVHEPPACLFIAIACLELHTNRRVRQHGH